MSRVALAAIAAALVAIALLAVRPPSEPGPFMRDFEAYYSAGRAVNARANPYDASLLRYERAVPGVEGTRNELLPFVGAPPSLALWSAIARTDYTTASRTWLFVLCAALFALVLATLECCDARVRSLDFFIVSICALSFVPITSDFVLGSPALVAYSAGAAALVASSRSTLLTAFSALVGSLQPNVALACAVIARGRRGLIALAFAASVLYGLGAAMAGFAWPASYAALLRAHGSAEQIIAIQYTPAAISFGLGLSRATATFVGLAVAFAALAFALFHIFRSKELVRSFAIACTALPFVSGFVHEHDLVLLFIPALWAIRNVTSRMQPLVVLAFGLASVHWMDFAQQPHAATQDIVLGLGALTAILAFGKDRAPMHYIAATAAFALILGGAWIGIHHPAPIWPNDMQPFKTPPLATAAYVWHIEQIQTGLEQPNPYWAALRIPALSAAAILLVILSLTKTNIRVKT
ncbi:MAG: glycosyltransferase 87 family protein [Candidatus Baltobacteraceae bacterium]